jgi:F420-dependent oxidoreductase-like protein
MDIRVLVEPQQGATYAQVLAFAQASERMGIDGFFVSDHLLKISDESGSLGRTDAWTTLAGLARETRTIRLGSLVTPVTFRPPGLLAVVVAEVHEMSGGRVELGMGLGWYEAEHQALGLDFPSVAERLKRLEEQLHVITGLWDASDERPFSFDGRHYTLEASGGLSKTFGGPRPPIILGGRGGTRILRLAAQFGDEVNVVGGTPGRLEIVRSRCRVACRHALRDPKSLSFSVMLTGCVGSTEAEFLRRARAIDRGSDELRQRALAGSLDEATAKLRAFARVGVHRVYLQILDLTDLDHLDLIGGELMERARNL